MLTRNDRRFAGIDLDLEVNIDEEERERRRATWSKNWHGVVFNILVPPKSWKTNETNMEATSTWKTVVFDTVVLRLQAMPLQHLLPS